MSSPSSSVAAIRTLALVGAAASGKTSLAEALLHHAGAIGAPGSLERGSMVSDFDPLERRMQHSLNSALMHLDHQGTRIHFIDTPGAPDFVGQSLPALEAVETAAVVVNAATGIEPMTVRMMEYAAQRRLDRLIIVNKIDAQGVDLPALLAQLQETFGRECLPLNLPAEGGSRVVDCFFNREGQTDFGAVEDAHRALVEQVVEVDGDFVERYLNDGDVDASELHAPLEQALREGHLIPVCFVSARTGAGLAQLLDVIDKLLPHPGEGNPPAFLKGEREEAQPLQAQPDPSLHVLAHVFKVTVDPYVGKMGIFRVHQGTVTRDSLLYIGDGRKPFKVNHLFMLQGKEHVEVSRALPGDLCAVAKIDELHFDAVLHDAAEDDHIHLQPLDFPVPVHGLAIEPKRHGDEQRLWEILTKLLDEDPCLKVEHVPTTNETIVYGLGELHLRVLLERLREVYKFEVQTRPPRIAYRETVTAAAEGHHRHKKQTGGAGQFGEVMLRVEPLPRGAGFEFVDQVKGGAIPGQFIPAVEKGVREVLASGAIAGYPVVDVRVVVLDGKSHSVDSKEIAFVTAGRKAFMAAIREARPIVLEPIVNVEILAPDTAMGDVTGDLSARRGQVNGTQNGAAGTMLVRGQVPLSELSNYQSRLNAMTSGQGRYTLALSHYDPVPPNTQQQLVSQYKVREEE
ncbi:elongation factor G [Azohydromonas caseinilytica]|uniref:Elongation factor G n=1 Tax=Azohydromonas caseinilytica TaxID=2728836 RepID=A0A848FBK6_9BURK|nr:elongation factor G [Azohydromonas caseinilytica]NML15351.1 elongation factor G [Azohydromonas caseinilytica]